MRLSALAAGLGVVLAVTVTGCATSVGGNGRLAAGAQTPQPTGSTEPTRSTAPTESSGPTGDDVLDCGQVRVSPPGAPYCYTAPALDEVDLGDPTAGEEGSFRTSYGFGPTDHIDVQAYAVGVDTDALTDAEIIGELAGVITDLETGGFEFDAEPTVSEVDGARSFTYTGTSTDGSQDIVAHFVFRGMNEVQVNCARSARARAIKAACSDVLDSLQIVG